MQRIVAMFLVGLGVALAPIGGALADAECPSAVARVPAGDWLLGTWRNTYYTLTFRRDGDRIRWAMERPSHPSERWGKKAAMNASGDVIRVSACAVELDGRYDWSESQYLVGKPMQYRGRFDGAGGLNGEIYGAAHEWMPMRFNRDQ